MTEYEIDQALLQLKSLVGYRVTNILYNEKAFQLSLSSDSEYLWLTVSLKPGHPYFFVGDKQTKTIKPLKKPLSTFGLSHFKDAEFIGAERIVEQGRVLQLNFSEDKFIRAILFPGGQNIQLSSGDKVVFAFKPKTLEVREDAQQTDSKVREDVQDYEAFWQQKNKANKNASGDSKEAELKKALKKKQNGLGKMQEKLAKLESEPWSQVGDWLKQNQTTKSPPDAFLAYIDSDQSLSWNIENSFEQSRKQKEKLSGTKDRIATIEQEIADLKAGKVSVKKAQTKSLLQVAEAQGRTRELGEGVRLFVGKSAKDNLAILRRAKPWYLWLHIRDYPGAYGIVERGRKDPEPSLDLLTRAGREIIKQSLKGEPEGVYEVIFAECRYVRPIPKVKAGQVTYSHEKVIRIQL